MPLVRIATTPWLRTHAELHAVAALVGAPHRVLGAVAGPSLAPELSGRLPVPPRLAALLHALRGRLVVTNPCAAARLPRVVGPLARAALRRALTPADGHPDAPSAYTPAPRAGVGDVRDAADARRLRALLAGLHAEAATALAPGSAAWAAAALYEPTTLDVRFADVSPHHVAPEPLPLLAVTRYRLVLVLGRDDPPAAWDALDAAATAAHAVSWPPTPSAEPVPWFAVRILVPDAVAAHGMDAGTLARWGAVTGRGGPSNRDAYWFADSWDRFREPGRRIGSVTPAEIARSRRAAPPSPPPASAWDAPAAALALSPAAERGVCVPPGYALVDCVGTLELAVVAAPAGP